MRILLVEDDEAMASTIHHSLFAECYEIDWCRSADKAGEELRGGEYDLIILDLTLPDESGISLLRRIRAENNVPVLVISAVLELEAKLMSFGAGADDYVTKPFELAELKARIAAILRRERRPDTEYVSAGQVSVECGRRTVTVDSRQLQLTPTEFSILEYLIRAKNRTIAKGLVARSVWGASEAREMRKLDVFLSTLRQKLAAVGGGDIAIETVWGEGLVLRADISATVGEFSRQRT